MKRILFSLLLALPSLFAAAQEDRRTLVVDASGAPLVGAVVLSHGGTPVGIVDKDGAMPQVAAECYPLTLRCLGFENATVAGPTAQIVMKETSYALGEVTVKPGERPACRVVCYIRETSGMMNDQDTVSVVSQYMADFMLKDDPSAKGFPTWDTPRLLNREIEQHSASGKELDKYELAALAWYPIICHLPDKDAVLPKELQGKTSGTFTAQSKKTGDTALICQLSPSQFSMYFDQLADHEGHTWSPAIFKLIGATMDINEFWGKTTYSFSPEETYSLRNLVAKTYSMKTLGRGKFFRSLFGSSTPVEMTSYIEIFPIVIEYLTREEAKALKKEKDPAYPMTKPEGAR